jgi:hypothetical protein
MDSNDGTVPVQPTEDFNTVSLPSLAGLNHAGRFKIAGKMALLLAQVHESFPERSSAMTGQLDRLMAWALGSGLPIA